MLSKHYIYQNGAVISLPSLSISIAFISHRTNNFSFSEFASYFYIYRRFLLENMFSIKCLYAYTRIYSTKSHSTESYMKLNVCLHQSHFSIRCSIKNQNNYNIQKLQFYLIYYNIILSKQIHILVPVPDGCIGISFALDYVFNQPA